MGRVKPGLRAERRRRHLVGCVMALYALLIFEGALRKWLLPEFSQWLFFVRDPLLLWAYVYGWRHGLWPRRSGWLALALGMALLGALLVPVQAATGGDSAWRWLLGAYGWRAYFLYIPLAFLVGATFTQSDLWRLARWTLWLLPPVALLVAAQFYAPLDAPINVGSAVDAGQQFRGLGQTGERTRPMGLFASGAGQQQFVAAGCALLLAASITPAARRRVGSVTLVAATLALLACLAFSGSRGTVLQCALSVLGALALVAASRSGRTKWRAVTLPLVAVAAGLLLAPWLLDDGVAALGQRWAAASAAEAGFSGGIFGRALFGLVDFTRLVGDVPLLGYGLGFGGNASITLKASVDGVLPGQLAETDFARHMVDLGPVMGIGFIAFRAGLVAWLALCVWRASRRSPDPWAMLLFSYAGYLLLLGQVTGQGTINGYGWLFAGLCIAACRHAQAGPVRAPALSHQPAAARAPRWRSAPSQVARVHP